MKRNFTLLVSAWILASLGVSAQTSDNFNSRPGISTSQVKGHLQGNCWQFYDFDVNQAGWTPGIEGDGAMVSNAGDNATQHTGIYTPVMDVYGNITVSFSYKFSSAIGSGERRWIKLYMTDADNYVVSMLDSIEITNVDPSATYNFNNTYDAGSGPYKLYINYQGTGGSARIAIDELYASTPLYYPGGCNSAPVAVNDNISGAANHHASGTVLPNDSDPNNDYFDAYLVTNSPHGNVVLLSNGNFTFTPNPGFAGSSTTFTYRICDNGYTPMCSNDATVTINFPTDGNLPVSLVDFKGLYKDNGTVELSWVTTFEQNSDRFEVERSMDGIKWENAGTLKALGNSSVRHTYQFLDEVGRNTANKRDLYYRLRQVDLDSKVAVSKILVVRVYNTRTLKMVSVTPNPAKNDIGVNVQLNEDAFVAMKILNSNGSVIMKKSVKAGAGSNSFILDGSSNLTPGLYVLEVIINSKERMIVKLIKE